MVEAVVSLCLLTLTWSLLFYSSHMTVAASRTAVSARHAAWAAGNGASVSGGSLTGDAFYSSMTITLNKSTGLSEATGGLSGGNPLLAVLFRMFPPIHKADVTTTPRMGSWVRLLTDVQFPIVHTGPELTHVSAHCEWDSVNRNWDELGDMIDDLVD